MNRTGWKWNLALGYAACVFAVFFLIGTRLVQGWGNWYSDNLNYREQTGALLHGSTALHHTPTAIRLDQVWHDGGVQQVWGLGVPVWRLPFELLAKVFGQPAFPDRLAFGAALALLVIFTLKVFLVPQRVNLPQASGPKPYAYPLRLAAVLVLLLFPPLITLCRFHFDVYEEAAAYAYLYAVGLFLGLVAFARTPTKMKYLALALLAGLAAFVRPTVGAFSLPTMLLLFYFARNAKLTCGFSVFGVLLFIFGGFLLFLTNQMRFGSGFEFGHSLNFNAFPIWFYTRFYNPFEHEQIASAVWELFGGMFHLGGQSKTPRWRNDYLTTFDLSYLILPTLLGGHWLAIRRLRHEKLLAMPLETKLALLWSGIAFVILALFYLRQPVMSSRYLLDFAPGFAVAIAGLLLALDKAMEQLLPSRRVWSWCALVAVVVWLGWENYSAKCTVLYSRSVNQRELLASLAKPIPELKPLPGSYEAGEALGKYAIGFNGVNWGADGRMPTVFAFFLSDPEYVKLTVAPVNPVESGQFEKIQAKVGLEFLEQESIVRQGYAHVITFKPPKREVYRHGIQAAFVGYVDPTNAASSTSPLRLYRVEWRQSNAVADAVKPAAPSLSR
jgi:hypothetical protein